jgi:hypothetical protein
MIAKVVHLERHPKYVAMKLNRTYPNNVYTIESIAPTYLHQNPE